MPSPNVYLDVRNFQSNGDGYTNVQASNGAWYSYKYTGGSDGHGNSQVTVGAGQAAIAVHLQSDSRYSITNISFNPAVSDFSWHGNSPTVAVINDTAVTVTTTKWTATVTDSTANCTVPCDPMIDNKPPAS